MNKHRGILIAFFCLLAAVILGLFVFRDNVPKVQNVFSYTDIVIAPGQNVKTLMVAGGDVVVYGNIRENVFVVDGDLAIKDGASVSGQTIVLGGNIMVAPQADIKHRPVSLLIHGHAFVPIIVSLLLVLAAMSLILLPMIFLLIGHYFKKSPLYLPAKMQLLKIQERWPGLYVVTGFVLSASMLFAFLTLSWKTFLRASTELFDDAFIWLVRYYANPALDQAMLIITDIGFGTGYIGIVGFTLIILAYKRRWSHISALAICLAGAGLLSFLLKNTFQRLRPDTFFLVTETSFSFPSGHALATMCFYGMLAFFIMRETSSWPLRLWVATLTLFLSLAIGISRIYLGVHYPTDVVAGYAVGFMWLTFCISLLLRYEKQNNSK